jgi:hypothetical protein
MTNHANRFAEAASLLASLFVTEQRTDGTEYVKLSSDAPEWAKTAAMQAHDGEMPNDSRYELIRDAAVAIAEQLFDSADEAREAAPDLTSDLLPCYTSDVLRWFADHPSRLADCDAAREAFGRRSDCEIYAHLTDGYSYAAESVLQILINEIDEAAPTLFNPDTDCQLLISDSQGIYIPQQWASGVAKSEAKEIGVDWWAIETCQHGPDSEFYWEAWQAILDSAEITDPDGSVWTLYQSGDLWAIRQGVELPSDW